MRVRVPPVYLELLHRRGLAAALLLFLRRGEAGLLLRGLSCVDARGRVALERGEVLVALHGALGRAGHPVLHRGQPRQRPPQHRESQLSSTRPQCGRLY
jgi:hypothetical protein